MDLDEAFGSTTIANEYKRTIRHMEVVRLHWDEVSNIKELIANDQADNARAVFMLFDEKTRIGLWRATTKGGCWTIEERRALTPPSSLPPESQ